MDPEVKSKRKIWTKDEVSMLLKCYCARKDEFQHKRTKIVASSVLEDMLQQGFTDPSISVTAIKNKMKSLRVAYEAAKCQRRIGPSVAPFMKELDEIFVTEPKTSNVYPVRLECGATSPQPTTPMIIITDSESLDYSGLYSKSSPGQHLNVDGDNSLLTVLTTPPRSSAETVNDHIELMAEMEKSESERELKVMFFERMLKSFEEHFREQERILREAHEKKIRLLEEFLKKMVNE